MNKFDTGRVTGRYVSSFLDAVSNPIPATGIVTFTPQAEYVLSNGTTILSTPIITVLDAQGYICTADTSRATGRYMRDIKGNYKPKYRGVTLQATDSANTNPTQWTWNVDFNLTIGDQKVNQKSFSFSLPTGTEVDLTSVTPVPGMSGYSTVAGPKGDSVRFLPEQDPEEIVAPTNGDIVPFAGELFGHTDGSWEKLGSLSTENASISSSTPDTFTGPGYSITAASVNNVVTLTGTIESEEFVLGQLDSKYAPKEEISLPILSSDCQKTSAITLFTNSSFQIAEPGRFSFSVSYVVAGE